MPHMLALHMPLSSVPSQPASAPLLTLFALPLLWLRSFPHGLDYPLRSTSFSLSVQSLFPHHIVFLLRSFLSICNLQGSLPKPWSNNIPWSPMYIFFTAPETNLTPFLSLFFSLASSSSYPSVCQPRPQPPTIINNYLFSTTASPIRPSRSFKTLAYSRGCDLLFSQFRRLWVSQRLRFSLVLSFLSGPSKD